MIRGLLSPEVLQATREREIVEGKTYKGEDG